MIMTARVLESGTSYATALYLNIVHFDRALAAEITNAKFQERIANLETQVSNLQRQVDRLPATPDTDTDQEDSSKLIQKAG